MANLSTNSECLESLGLKPLQYGMEGVIIVCTQPWQSVEPQKVHSLLPILVYETF